MNLTIMHKRAIVRAVIADIPRKFPAREVEVKLQAIVDESTMKVLPPKIAAVFADRELRMFLEFGNTNAGYMLPESGIGNVTGLGSIRYIRDIGLRDEDGKLKFRALIDGFIEEHGQIQKAQLNLEAAITGIRTVKRFKETFPELEKYLPAEFEKTPMLPAIANVMASLSSLGWPKDAQPA